MLLEIMIDYPLSLLVCPLRFVENQYAPISRVLNFLRLVSTQELVCLRYLECRILLDEINAVFLITSKCLPAVTQPSI